MSASSLMASMSDRREGRGSFSEPADSHYVPEGEVNECPLCSRKFRALVATKHHCHACGKVVCSSCCNNLDFVPRLGKKAKVCDPCHDLSRVDKDSSLTDSLSTSRQVEASLKEHLKEMTQKADWFRGFLLQISAEVNPPPGQQSFGGSTGTGGSLTVTDADIESSFVSVTGESVTEEELSAPQRDPATAAKESLDAAVASLKNPDLIDLIHRSRRRWNEVCSEVSANREESDRVELDVEALDREFRECEKEVKDVYKAVRSMEGDLKTRAMREAERDALWLARKELQVELDGLDQRMATLEEGLSGGGSGFWAGSFSVRDRSSNASSDGGQAGGTSSRCSRGACIRPGASCSLM